MSDPNASAPTTHLGPGPDPASALEAFRREIDELDRQIVDLMARRLEKVQQVVALKKEMQLPIYHPAREEDLISRRREQARSAGLEPDHIEEIYRCILRQSRVRQTVHVAKRGVRTGYKILIAGGAGRMGSYFGGWLREAGYEVRTLDVDDWPRVAELCAGINLALVSVPIHFTEQVIRQLAPHLPPDCVLADLTSIKSVPLKAMLNAHPGPVIGLHPLFGPTTASMDKQIVVVTQGRDAEACGWVVEQLNAWGNIVEVITAAEHDALMDLVQGLRHFATFAFGRFLAHQKVNLARTLEFSSPIYRLELGMVGRLFAQDASLYADIIFASPERRKLLQDYIASLQSASRMLEKGETDEFYREFAEVGEWFGPFCEQALRESSFLIDKLVERF